MLRARTPVGAGLLAKVVNDDAGNQKERGALRFFAGKPAPTEKQKRRQRIYWTCSFQK